VVGDRHISFTTTKIGSLVDVNQSKLVFLLEACYVCRQTVT